MSRYCFSSTSGLGGSTTIATLLQVHKVHSQTRQHLFLNSMPDRNYLVKVSASLAASLQGKYYYNQLPDQVISLKFILEGGEHVILDTPEVRQ